ncbi:MAG TPA: hypothetical protein VMN57_02135 [Anaerolineales bacterium]|nr:hypothetical protein [Anaerolineales bacterium]
MTEISPGAIILVAVLPGPRDLEIARLLGWYRIPLRTAPKLLGVDYLAFYQPGSFGDQGGQIAYLAPVIGHELVTRAELLHQEPDHPRAQEEYFKLQLGSLIPLRRPIRAGSWKRFAFFYTTGEYLRASETIGDLIVRSDDRREVWTALRERAIAGSVYFPADWPPEPAPDLLEALLELVETPHQL